MRNGMYKEAIAVFETDVMTSKALEKTNHETFRLGFLACAYALSGERDKSLKILHELHLIQKQAYFSKELIAELIALVYTCLGEKNEALTWLESAYDKHSLFLVHFMFDPIFDPLRSEPRFQALLKNMGLEK